MRTSHSTLHTHPSHFTHTPHINTHPSHFSRTPHTSHTHPHIHTHPSHQHTPLTLHTHPSHSTHIPHIHTHPSHFTHTPSHSQDDPNLEDYNVDQKVEDFVKAIATQQKFYRHNHIMLTMGSDFQWESAREWYKNLDKLMKYTMEKVSGVA